MKSTITILLALLLVGTVHAQKNPTAQAQPIVEEGIRLYKSEMASWHGTDLFLAQYEDHSRIGGYLSYTEKETSRCIFISRDKTPQVIGSVSFDSSFDIEKAELDLSVRALRPMEADLFELRQAAAQVINTDTLFKVYKNTSLNIIPLIDGKEKKVYVLTGPQITGVVIFGNDYLLRFNKNNKLIERKALHKNIIPIEYGSEGEDEEVFATMHSHTEETGAFITATDICTLMLYAEYAGWSRHQVVSKEYLNIWNCDTNKLTVVPMDTIRSISEDGEAENQERKKPRKRDRG